MQAKNYYSFNGKIFLETENHISINNRSFRYGDGFFETIKLKNNIIQLKKLHFDRIAQSLATLNLSLPKNFSFAQLEQQIIAVATKNKHNKLARIRITFFRQDAELFAVTNNTAQSIIQSFQLQQQQNFNQQNGLIIDIFPFAQKSCDIFSTIKSNNYLPYTMAAMWAKQHKLNDALLLNCNNAIADSCIANVFIIKNKKIVTPSLQQGCVNGVMRKHIIETLQEQKNKCVEKRVTLTDILNADEIFLTNAIKGIMSVRQCGKQQYDNKETERIYNLIFNNKE